MVMSMTGYGNHTVTIEDVTIVAEVRTVNSRYLDFSPKIPHTFNFLEGDIKKIAQNYFHRGRIEVFLFISYSQFDDKTISVNWHMMDQYVKQLNEAKQRYNLCGDIPITMLTQIDSLFNVNEAEKDVTSMKEPILEAVNMSCEKVFQGRKKEGLFLINDIKKRLTNIENMLQYLTESRQDIIKRYGERIEERIQQYLSNKQLIENDRLYQEIALLAEKGDITEEITRLSSHVEQFKLMTVNEGPIGRQLDFIIQEMHREVNTIGAKSVDTKTSQLVVSMKSDIDKIKEQVQNIE